MRRGRLKVLNPCHEDYDAMRGKGATRYCEVCSKNVHNLSSMTEPEANAFLAEHDGQNVCVRYRARQDGRVIFKRPPDPRAPLLVATTLALAACTGYVDGDELDSPDDGMVCRDASGYAVPCDEIDEGVVPFEEASDDAGAIPDPAETTPDPATQPVPPEPDPEALELIGDIDVGGEGEGCPVPAPTEYTDIVELQGAVVSRSDVIVGDIPVSNRSFRRGERRDRREARRDARRRARRAR